MPRHRHRRKLGGSFKKFLSGAKSFLKKSKLLSTVGSQLNKTFVPKAYQGIGNSVVDYAKKQGYGRRRRRRVRGRGSCKRGHGLRPVGGSMMPVGEGRRKKSRVRRVGRRAVQRVRLPRRKTATF